MTKRDARELALQVLFQMEFSPSLSFVKSLDTFRANFTAPPEVWNYALTLLECFNLRQKEIDDVIQNHSAHWRLPRMALVDKNIMRIAVCELLFQDNVPPAVAINEAIEIAKKYGSQDSPAFINGVLDQVRKSKIEEDPAT